MLPAPLTLVSSFRFRLTVSNSEFGKFGRRSRAYGSPQPEPETLPFSRNFSPQPKAGIPRKPADFRCELKRRHRKPSHVPAKFSSRSTTRRDEKTRLLGYLFAEDWSSRPSGSHEPTHAAAPDLTAKQEYPAMPTRA